MPENEKILTEQHSEDKEKQVTDTSEKAGEKPTTVSCLGACSTCPTPCQF